MSADLNEITKTVDLDRHTELVAELQRARAELKLAQERESDLKNELLHVMGPATHGLVGGATLVRLDYVQLWRFDKDRFEREHPGIYDLYEVEGTRYVKVNFPSPKPAKRRRP